MRDRKSLLRLAGLVAALLACTSSPGSGSGSGADGGAAGGGGTSGNGSGGAGGGETGSDANGLASRYPGDRGIAADPAVVWSEDFEEGSVGGVTARYDDFKNAAGMALVADVPPGSAGAASMRLTAGGSASATDLYKRLSDHDQLFVRWYAKYEPGALWHHSGVWIGGYNPPSSWPNPQAGLKPAGDDRFSVSLEPVWDVGGAAPRLDFYNYWMSMHSWMEQPSGGDAYYGNALVHQGDFTVDEGRWVCLEVHVELNPDPSSRAGAVLEVWKNDVLIQRFDESGPLGYWIRDKFCPGGADGRECTDYPAPANTVLDLRFRSSQALHLNAFWPQNYITEAGAQGRVQYDDMVVATERVGCLR